MELKLLLQRHYQRGYDRQKAESKRELRLQVCKLGIVIVILVELQGQFKHLAMVAAEVRVCSYLLLLKAPRAFRQDSL